MDNIDQKEMDMSPEGRDLLTQAEKDPSIVEFGYEIVRGGENLVSTTIAKRQEGKSVQREFVIGVRRFKQPAGFEDSERWTGMIDTHATDRQKDDDHQEVVLRMPIVPDNPRGTAPSQVDKVLGFMANVAKRGLIGNIDGPGDRTEEVASFIKSTAGQQDFSRQAGLKFGTNSNK